MNQILNGIVHARRGGRRVSGVALGGAAALAMAACAGATAPAENTGPGGAQQGTIGMALAGQAPSGAKYRLRRAMIELDGPTTAYISTEDDPNRTLFSADVIAGSYTVSLDGGWQLERVDFTGAGEAVDAVLTSSNPQTVSVFVGIRTPVEFHFQVSGEDIELDRGGIDIGIDVDD